MPFRHLIVVAVIVVAVIVVAVIATPLCVLAGNAQDSDRFSPEDFTRVEKIDIHFHLHTENTDFVTLARRDRFSFLNIATQSAGPDVMEQKHKTMFLQYGANPDRIACVSSFSMDGWDDRSYFRRNPQYHMYLHPEMPSYQDQIDARDRMLAKHKNLPFLAAHLASLEWSVDELAKFLDRFPNAVAGVAARLGQLQYQSQQDRDKVIQFLNKYQDRVLYGSDTGVGPTSLIPERYEQTRERWLRDWEYFNTDKLIEVPELDDPVQGLALSKQVVEKIYRINAKHLFPNSWGRIN